MDFEYTHEYTRTNTEFILPMQWQTRVLYTRRISYQRKHILLVLRDDTHTHTRNTYRFDTLRKRIYMYMYIGNVGMPECKHQHQQQQHLPNVSVYFHLLFIIYLHF